MYLTDLCIENVGPIENLNLELPLSHSGTPKPAVLVGGNGSGKTIVQATIADALILLASPVFQDAAPHEEQGHAYFKVCGQINQRVDASFGVSLLRFRHGEKTATYVDKSGILNSSEYLKQLESRFGEVSWPENELHKKWLVSTSRRLSRSLSHRCSVFFQPVGASHHIG